MRVPYKPNRLGDRVRVVILAMTFEPEPGALRGLPLARELTARGHTVRVITGFPQYPLGRTYPGYRQAWRKWESFGGIDVLRLLIFPSHDQSAFRRSLTYLSFGVSALVVGVPLIGPVDVVLMAESQPTSAFAAVALKWLRRAPLICSVADIWPDSVVASRMIAPGRMESAAVQVTASLSRWLFSQADAVTVISPGFKRILIERGVHPERVHVALNWADEEVFHPVARDEVLADELGFSGRFNVLYAGNFGELQDLETVLRAAHELRHNTSIRIVLMGTGPKEMELKTLQKELKLENVTFLDRRDYRDMPRIYALAEVLLVHLRDLPFLRATIPSKTQVSLACGRPVLMAAEGDAAGLIQDSGGGVVCRPQDPAVMASTIQELWALPPGALERLGAQGRDFYMEHLSLRAGAKQIDELLDAVCTN